MKNGVKPKKCVNCKHCFYLKDGKAYCGQRGDEIEEQYPSCPAYKEVETK